MNSHIAHAVAVLGLATSILSSCGGDQTPVSNVQITEPQTLRQLRAIGGNPLKLSVSVNSGSEQFFTFNNDGSLSLDITGVRPNELNDIQLVWYETLNGFDIEISAQEQEFLADGNTNIDAPHQHTQYDYDGDGVSNYDERIAGTCVWFTEDDCVLDAPNRDSVSGPGFDNNTIVRFPEQSGINILFNSDFSQGLDGWHTHSLEQIVVSNGEICFSTKPESGSPEHAGLGSLQGQFLLKEGVRYTLAADMRADTSATPRLVLHGPEPNFIHVLDTAVAIDTTYRTVSASFIAESDQAVLVGLALGDGTSKRYCVDNMKLVKGEL